MDNNKIKTASVYTLSILGLSTILTKVEVHIVKGLPSFNIVGLGDKAIYESKERIRSCLYTVGVQIPNSKITVNLSPASLPKEGTHYDLPIILGILKALKDIDIPEKSIIAGELSLNGEIVDIKGILPMAVWSKENSYQIICGIQNAKEAKLVYDDLIFADNIMNLLQTINGELALLGLEKEEIKAEKIKKPIIYGQSLGKRAIEIAAAARHHILLVGPHGVGKSTLAKSIRYLLPKLDAKESLEVTSIYSLAGLLKEKTIIEYPQFREPHVSSSIVSIIGGGKQAQPGEMSLAHKGVLFFDELPEFAVQVIDSLRTPLEEKCVHISRATYKVSYPADIQFITSMNPCKCGLLSIGRCRCTKSHYLNKISGPILDRIDIFSHLDTKFDNEDDSFPCPGRIILARELQVQRFGCLNSEIPVDTLFADGCFSTNLNKSNFLSFRSYVKTARLARTIADLNSSKNVDNEHISEAQFFRDNFNNLSFK